jgi:hypothetical protein
LPRVYTLDQAYPNPFNPVAIIRFGLPEKSRITLKVYNLLGQLVDVLADEIVDAGYRELEWNAQYLSSGVYFYRLEGVSILDPSRSFVSVKKMLLTK